MTRFWIGLWLLSASWLFGLDYYFPGSIGLWIALLCLGTLAVGWACDGTLSDASGAAPDTPAVALPVVLSVCLVPTVVLTPWPFRAAPLLLAAGLFLAGFPKLGRWGRALFGGLVTTGLILLGQSLALLAYKHFTARSHELPWPLPQLLAGAVRLIGIEAGTDGSHLVLPTMRENHALAATWDLVLDPATFCFLAGGLLILSFHRWGIPRTAPSSGLIPDPVGAAPALAGKPGKSSGPKGKGPEGLASLRLWKRLPLPPGIGWLMLALVIWVPLRAALLCGLLLQRALRTDYEAPLNLMGQFWSPWTHLVLLLPLVLLVAVWTRAQSLSPGLALPGPRPAWRTLLLAAAGAGGAVVVLSLAVQWDPIGTRKAGRIAIDEFHSKWEPTDRPMDTEWYGHLSGYNYACLYDLCSKIYEMSRLTNALTDASLARLDVLVLKVPTERFAAEEVDAVVRYVQRGGGLLLIGEHTDVFNTGYNLNTVARRFGFSFRYDCLFGTQSFFDQFYVPWVTPHPALRYLRHLDFATSCSIDPGRSRGRGVIVSAGLKNSLADYHANNYYPQAVDHAGMRYGAFVQLWSVRQGRGRVLAFTDSTIFSNFSAFEPGKRELFLGMLEWLNRQDGIGNPRPWLLLLGLGLLGWSLRTTWRQPDAWMLLIVAGTLGWTAVNWGLLAHQRRSMPEPKAVHPWTWLTIDRTVCDTALSKGGFIAGKPDGFGIFERWILRLGYFIRRERGPAVFHGDVVVFCYPTKAVTGDFQATLMRYVEGGGKVLVIDSPKNEQSTAAGLLEPFGLSKRPLSGNGGTLSGPANWPAVPIEAAHEILGGRALFELGGKAVGAVARQGKGMVVVIGFGSRFADANMGTTGDVEPDVALRKVFDLQFALLRAIVQDKIPNRTEP